MTMDRSELVSLAIWIHREVGEPGKGEDLLAAYSRYIDSGTAPIVLRLPDQQTICLLSYMWAHYGLKEVQVGHKMAAALMSTTIAPSVLETIRPPWPTMRINVPNGMLKIDGKDGPEDLLFVLVAHTEKGWTYSAVAGDDTGLWGINLPADQVTKAKWGDSPDHVHSELYPKLSSLDDRALVLLWRYVFGICLLMQDNSNYKVPKEGGRKKKNSRQSKEPTVRVYVIAQKPSYDCRESVRQYLLGSRPHGPQTVQCLVAGHFKQQVHGPQKTLRKTIWVEPYWRGPDDAPILVRPRSVGEGSRREVVREK